MVLNWWGGCYSLIPSWYGDETKVQNRAMIPIIHHFYNLMRTCKYTQHK